MSTCLEADPDRILFPKFVWKHVFMYFANSLFVGARYTESHFVEQTRVFVVVRFLDMMVWTPAFQRVENLVTSPAIGETYSQSSVSDS
jgi:hypothetical protein